MSEEERQNQTGWEKWKEVTKELHSQYCHVEHQMYNRKADKEIIFFSFIAVLSNMQKRFLPTESEEHWIILVTGWKTHRNAQLLWCSALKDWGSWQMEQNL